MHAEIGTNPMAGAVIEIQPCGPQMLPRQNIQIGSGRAFGKTNGGEGDMPFENAGEAIAHFVRGRTKGYGARYIGRAVEILPAAIEKKKLAFFKPCVGSRRGAVMDDSAMRARACDRSEA